MGSEDADQELAEYAESIGISLPTEPHLVWIAEKGCHQPLPPGWLVIGTDDQRDAYFYEEATGNTSWEHPMDPLFRGLVIEERRKGLGLVGQLGPEPITVTKHWLECGGAELKSELGMSPAQETDSSAGGSPDPDSSPSPPSFSPDSRASPFHQPPDLFAREEHKEETAQPKAPSQGLESTLMANSMVRIQIDEVVSRNWVDYCRKSTESYSRLLELCNL